MLARFTSTLGYMAAACTLAVALLAPFLLMGAFSKAVARSGIEVDPTYVGGAIAQTIRRGRYDISISEPVYPHLLQRTQPFVQLAFSPAGALPQHVDDTVDIDGDGRPDLRVRFSVPRDPKAALTADVLALDPRYTSLRGVQIESFSSLIARVDGKILVRVPLSRSVTH